jgi:hypothetical protein
MLRPELQLPRETSLSLKLLLRQFHEEAFASLPAPSVAINQSQSWIDLHHFPYLCAGFGQAAKAASRRRVTCRASLPPRARPSCRCPPSAWRRPRHGCSRSCTIHEAFGGPARVFGEYLLPILACLLLAPKRAQDREVVDIGQVQRARASSRRARAFKGSRAIAWRNDSFAERKFARL